MQENKIDSSRHALQHKTMKHRATDYIKITTIKIDLIITIEDIETSINQKNLLQTLTCKSIPAHNITLALYWQIDD
jgi:hypothetical protein